MWIYEKKLEYPVRVYSRDLRMAKFLTAQYGGPDSELSASIRYLNQRYTMPTPRTKGLLTDIGTEEMAHWEIVGTMIYRLIQGATPDELERAGLGSHYALHDKALFPADANGVPWTAAYIQAHADPVADLHEDLAAEQKARATYEHLICLTDDPGIKDTLRWLREREVIHFQRFGEALDHVQGYLSSKKVF
ncbi:MAG: manganese catalase family protein [Bacillota bacterium]